MKLLKTLLAAATGCALLVLTGPAATATTPITFTSASCQGAAGDIASCVADWTGGTAPYTAAWTPGTPGVTIRRQHTTDLGGSPDVWESSALASCMFNQTNGSALITVTDATGAQAFVLLGFDCIPLGGGGAGSR